MKRVDLLHRPLGHRLERAHPGHLGVAGPVAVEHLEAAHRQPMRLREAVGPPQRRRLRHAGRRCPARPCPCPPICSSSLPGLLGVGGPQHPQRVDAVGQVVERELDRRPRAAAAGLGWWSSSRPWHSRRYANGGPSPACQHRRMAVTACPLDCPDTCAIDVTVQDGRITRIDAAPGNPTPTGGSAPRCASTPSGCTVLTGCSRRSCAPAPRARASSARRRGTRRSSWRPPRSSGPSPRTAPASVVPYTYNSSVGEAGRRAVGPSVAPARRGQGAPHDLRGHRRRRPTPTCTATCSAPIRATCCTAA